MSREEGFQCLSCPEYFSKREAKLRDDHILEVHHSYLRWQCRECTYVTSSRRKFDHQKHWEGRHFGEAEPPKPIYVRREVEDQRRAQEDARRRERELSQTRRASLEQPTRTSPRFERRRSASSKRSRHPSSPGSSRQPCAKRSSSRVSLGPRSEAASRPPRTDRSSSGSGDRHRARKSYTPQRKVRSTSHVSEAEASADETETEQERTTRRDSVTIHKSSTTSRAKEAEATAKEAEVEKVPDEVVVPVAGTSTGGKTQSGRVKVRVQPPPQPVELELHPGGDDSSLDGDRVEGAEREVEQERRAASPARDSDDELRFERVERWGQGSSLDECRAMRRILEERELQLSGTVAPVRPVQEPAPDTSLVWRPGPGFSVTLEYRKDPE